MFEKIYFFLGKGGCVQDIKTGDVRKTRITTRNDYDSVNLRRPSRNGGFHVTTPFFDAFNTVME